MGDDRGLVAHVGPRALARPELADQHHTGVDGAGGVLAGQDHRLGDLRHVRAGLAVDPHRTGDGGQRVRGVDVADDAEAVAVLAAVQVHGGVGLGGLDDEQVVAAEPVDGVALHVLDVGVDGAGGEVEGLTRGVLLAHLQLHDRRVPDRDAGEAEPVVHHGAHDDEQVVAGAAVDAEQLVDDVVELVDTARTVQGDAGLHHEGPRDEVVVPAVAVHGQRGLVGVDGEGVRPAEPVVGASHGHVAADHGGVGDPGRELARQHVLGVERQLAGRQGGRVANVRVDLADLRPVLTGTHVHRGDGGVVVQGDLVGAVAGLQAQQLEAVVVVDSVHAPRRADLVDDVAGDGSEVGDEPMGRRGVGGAAGQRGLPAQQVGVVAEGAGHHQPVTDAAVGRARVDRLVEDDVGGRDGTRVGDRDRAGLAAGGDDDLVGAHTTVDEEPGGRPGTDPDGVAAGPAEQDVDVALAVLDRVRAVGDGAGAVAAGCRQCGAGVQVEGVDAAGVGDPVLTPGPGELVGVVAGLTVEVVGAGVTAHGVVAASTTHDVGAGVAVEGVVAVAAEELVGSPTPTDGVGAGPTVEHVVTSAALQGVVAVPAVEHQRHVQVAGDGDRVVAAPEVGTDAVGELGLVEGEAARRDRSRR